MIEISREIADLCRAQDMVYVGFSGGADSTAALLLLSDLVGTRKICAVHFQHNLRGEAALADARWCQQFCESRSILFREVSLDVKGTVGSGEGIEAAARRLRNNYWQSIGECCVGLGHHADDRAENVILRLCRGSNVTGLTSMRAIQTIGEVRYFRPLLGYSRKDIIDYLDDAGVTDWRHDASNDDDCYKRNFIRHSILPEIQSALPYAGNGIQQSLTVLSEDADFIELAAQDKFSEIAGQKCVPVDFWLGLHRALLIRVLRYWIAEQLGHEVLPNKRFIDRFLGELEERKRDGRQYEIPLSGGVCFILLKGQVSLRSADASLVTPPEIQWDWRIQPVVHWGNWTFEVQSVESIDELEPDCAAFDADSLPDRLTIRSRENGDNMVPFGRKSPVKLKKLFGDRKVSSEESTAYPLVCCNGSIVWIPQVRRSNFFPVSGTAVVIRAQRIVEYL